MAVVALVVEHRESKRFVRGNGKWRARTSNDTRWCLLGAHSLGSVGCCGCGCEYTSSS